MKLQLAILACFISVACRDTEQPLPVAADLSIEASAALNPRLVAQGKQIFRFDTFGDETFWTDTLQMHTVISTGVSPATALAVGLKVDADALPAAVKQGIQDGTVKLDQPATTVTLQLRDARAVTSPRSTAT